MNRNIVMLTSAIVLSAAISFAQDGGAGAPAAAAAQSEPATGGDSAAADEPVTTKGDQGDTGVAAGWLPGTRLFHTLKADPRKTVFSGALRYGDRAFDEFNTTPSGVKSGVLGDERLFGSFSGGGRLPVYRWKLPEGFFQFGLEGSVRALFALKDRDTTKSGDMSTMLNADYLVALPTEYAWKDLALQFRFYHISSHAGDELMNLYPGFDRVNLSFEALDLFVSYYIVPQARLYFGLGCVIHHAQSGKFDPVSIEYGAEFRPFAPMKAGRLFWQPFAALHFRNLQNNSWAIDGSYSLGVEFVPDRKFLNTRFQIALDFYHGRSCEGQFYRKKTSYLDVAFSFEL